MSTRPQSESIVIQSPMSFVGSARRAWKLTGLGPQPWSKIATVPLALAITAMWWIVCLVWLIIFGLFMLPWRLLRRGQRRRKQDAARHREMLAALAGRDREGTS